MKTDKLTTIKALLRGDITIADVVKKVKFVFKTDPADEPLISAAEYMRAFEPRQERTKKTRRKEKHHEETHPPESPLIAPQRQQEPRPQESTMIFSTDTERYDQIRQQLAMNINRFIR
ncbi:MAG: hypothetical protein ABI113_03595 [Mucilaginibacter sp.]